MLDTLQRSLTDSQCVKHRVSIRPSSFILWSKSRGFETSNKASYVCVLRSMVQCHLESEAISMSTNGKIKINVVCPVDVIYLDQKD